MQLKKFIKEKFLPINSNMYAEGVFLNTLLNIAISRCAIASISRSVVADKPQSWEFSGFSQNGEDGIIEYLISGLVNPNRYFIEIGSGNGLENNTSYLAHIKKYAGLQIEGNSAFHAGALKIKPWLIECLNWFVNEDTIPIFFQKALFKNPDVFSIDIDGVDYYITKWLLENGLCPKIIVVEYNSAFGPDRSITIPYNKIFNMFETPFPYLYYGVSIKGWMNLFSKYNYEFVTVESNGVNGFFIQVKEFQLGFLTVAKKIEFAENMHQLRLFRQGHAAQFEMIKNLPFEHI